MSKEIINQIEQLKERIEEKDRDIEIYSGMIECKKMDKVALEEMVDKLNKSMNKEYGK